MERILLTIAICGFPVMAFAQDQGIVSDNSGRFMRSDEIIVVSTEHGRTVNLMKTKVVRILPNGDLKIYGEKFTNVDQSTWKVTFSATVRSTDISAEGTAHSKDLRNIHLTRKKFYKDKERVRPKWRRKKYNNIVPTIKKDAILRRQQTAGHKQTRQRQRSHRHLRSRRVPCFYVAGG